MARDTESLPASGPRMRSLAFFAISLAACGSVHGAPDVPDAVAPTDAAPVVDDASLAPPVRGFQIKNPPVTVKAGQEVTFCYYFRTPNTTDLAVQKWASHMTTGSHHMIVFFTPTKLKEPGTISSDQCGFGSNGNGPVWTYSAQTPDAEAALPIDDGTGVPVGQIIAPGQYGFIQMHYLNASDQELQAHVELNAYAYDDGVQVTPAAPYVTYNLSIHLDPGSMQNPTPGMVNGNCPIPANADHTQPKFYVMSTHSHKQSVHTFVKDGATMVFDSTSWDHPGATAWNASPFFTFSSGKLSYQCEYMNPTNRTIITGDSAATDEMCMAIGYYFPAPGGIGHLCLNSSMIN
jgi:hypothetical protein